MKLKVDVTAASETNIFSTSNFHTIRIFDKIIYGLQSGIYLDK